MGHRVRALRILANVILLGIEVDVSSSLGVNASGHESPAQPTLRMHKTFQPRSSRMSLSRLGSLTWSSSASSSSRRAFSM